MRGITIPKTQTIGGSHVLPAGPYTPNMPQFDSVDISRDSLPAHNAKTAMAGLHIRPISPEPTVVVDTMAGAGAMRVDGDAARSQATHEATRGRAPHGRPAQRGRGY